MKRSFRYPGKPWILVTGLFSLGALALMYHFTQNTFPPMTGRAPVGHAFGIIAALLILLVTLYSARKARPGWNFGSLETWLQMHIWLGVVSLVFAFVHTGLQFNALFAVITFALLVTVVLSGAVGYIIYLMIPSRMARAEGRVVIPEEVAARLEEMRDEMYQFCSESGEAYMTVYEKVVEPLFEKGQGGEFEVPPLYTVVGGIGESDREAFAVLEKSIEECERLFSDLAVHFRYTRRLKLWLVFHIPLSVGLIVFLIVHIVTMLLY